MTESKLLEILLKANPPGRPQGRPGKPKPKPPPGAMRPPRIPKMLPNPNCNFAYFGEDNGLVAGSPDEWGPAHVTSAFAAGQEAAEGDLRFQWTHVMLIKITALQKVQPRPISDPWPVPNEGARPGNEFDAAVTLASKKVYFYALGIDLFKFVPPLNLYQYYQFPLGGTGPIAGQNPNGLAYFVIFIEKVNRQQINEHWRVYLRRDAGKES